MTKKELEKYSKRRAIIMRLHKLGIPQAEIGRRLGMKRQRVNQIINGA